MDDRACSILGLNVVPGHPDDQGAYRSELAGLFGIVLVVAHLCLWAGIGSGGIEIGCDGLSALNKAFDTRPLEPADPHFDMLSSLCKKIAASAITYTTGHIEGIKTTTLLPSWTFGLSRIFKWIILPRFFGCATLILLRCSIPSLTKVSKSGSATASFLLIPSLDTLITSTDRRSLTGTSPTYASQHAMLDALIGTSTLLRCNAFPQLASNDGWQSTLLASVVLA
jgi:hypothetical protein